MIRTGIFGGSFNPIHNGHVALARQLRQLAALDEVWLMVSPQNPMKQTAGLLADDCRLELARAALQHEPGIEASGYEMQLPRPSYTWNTLQALRRDYPDREFVLMIGGDNWARFGQWYRAADILRHYPVVVYPRRGAEACSLPPAADGARVRIVEAALIDISSTEIRERIRAGRSIRGMVPPAVADLISKNGYYA